MSDILDLLHQTRTMNGSDLHISVNAPPCARVHGSITPLNESPLTSDETRDLILDVLDDHQRARLENDREIDFAIQVRDLGRFRGNAHYTRSAIEAAFRFIPDEVPDLSELGHGETVERLCKLHQGLVLVTGVTGSGKSTTLASMVKRISEQRASMIVSIEDPVEYIIPHGKSLVKQRQIGSDTKSFSNALRAALRQDPDVIMVSELRDLDTIRTAITAAETGHLVLGTLHTQDAPKAIDRLVDAFPAEQQPLILTQLGNCLEGVVAQRLVERCDMPGRVMTSEIMIGNHAIRTCIRERKWEQLVGLIQVGAASGMHTFDDSLAHLARSGYISRETATQFARDQQRVENELVDFNEEQP